MNNGQPMGGTERGETYTVAPHSCPHCEETIKRGGGRYNCDTCGRRWGVIYIEYIHSERTNDTALDDGESTRENRSPTSKTSSKAETTRSVGSEQSAGGTERSLLFDDQDRDTFRAAVETWGIDAQADMAEEEAAEFIVASKHYARGKVDADDLIDELADVRIMQEQLAEFIGRERVEQRIQEKMDRLRERLDQSTATESDRSGDGDDE